jgi:hypothetical protein
MAENPKRQKVLKCWIFRAKNKLPAILAIASLTSVSLVTPQWPQNHTKVAWASLTWGEATSTLKTLLAVRVQLALWIKPPS